MWENMKNGKKNALNFSEAKLTTSPQIWVKVVYDAKEWGSHHEVESSKAKIYYVMQRENMKLMSVR